MHLIHGLSLVSTILYYSLVLFGDVFLAVADALNRCTIRPPLIIINRRGSKATCIYHDSFHLNLVPDLAGM